MSNLALLALALSVGLPTGGDWPQFRGPGGRCVADDTPIPERFGPDEAVLWKAAVPPGHSSPCVVGQRIFLTGFEEQAHVVLALDRASGKELWRRSFEGEQLPPYLHPDGRPALPTTAADAERVVAYFGGYGLVALTHAGELAWEKRMPHPGHGFGVGTSPILYQGLLILSRDGAPEAGILGLDVTDGSELWRIDRFQHRESHGTPFVWENADRTELVVGGSGTLSSYDLGTTALLWSVEGLTSFPCTTPTGDADTLYFAAWSTGNATGRSFWEAGFARSLELSDEEIEDPSRLFRRLDANGDGRVVPDEVPESRAKDAFAFLDIDQDGAWSVEELVGPPDQTPAPGANLMIAVPRGVEGEAAKAVRWSYRRGLPYVSSPLLYRDRVWLTKAGGFVTCLDAESGAAVFERERLEDRSEYYLSPVGAGGRVLVGSAEGTLSVLDAEADELTVVHTVRFEEELFATPAVLDGTLYLRTTATMWAFGERE